ncbi:fasciclin domain-containing protein [Ktedonobacter robiniae]|uniref:Beta-Ig-H3/fasciclin n=1 Tax=Ktedonobacter robiniae TaxID=2778365 RepID=A0ABQ3UGS0_9CHLR|nr:fasciclin domain-containing protein [Ktedonobacter robiniae]GHO51906.1 beta-Ig-H3/fasciclin [Ktedonobacter robiniae]
MERIIDILEERSYPYTFHDLDALVRAVGLEYLLQEDTQITLFAPHDQALNELKDVNEFDLLKHLSKLKYLLDYHIVPERISLADLRREVEQSHSTTIQLQTRTGRLLTIDMRNPMRVGGVPVLEADLFASNGVIHTLDGLLMPPDLDLKEFLQPGVEHYATIYNPDELMRHEVQGPGA